MERLCGPLRAADLPPLPAARPGAAAAQAAAHAAGRLHRDVKPSNILLEAGTGRAKLLDFGLARAAQGGLALTVEGSLLGTPAYMSPEQIQEPGAVDARADVYGLGVTLYEALIGEPPFHGTPARVLHQVLHDDPQPPRALNDQVPRDLETVCLRAMAKEPGRRYPTAAALADDLRRFLGGEPVHARPAGRAGRLWRWCRRNPRVAALSGAVLALLVLLAAGSTLAAVRIAAAKVAADRERAAAEEARRRADASARAADQDFALALDALSILIGGVQDDLDRHPGTLPLRQRLTELACAEKWAAADPDSLEARRAVAMGWADRGYVALRSGSWEAAEAAFAKAIGLAEAMVAADPDRGDLRNSLNDWYSYLGDVRRCWRQPAAAREALQRDPRTAMLLRSVTDLDPIRQDASYQELLADWRQRLRAS